MKSDHIKSALVIPTTTELNRGDQALAWKAVEIAKLCGFEKVTMFTESPLMAWIEDSEGAASIGEYQVVAPLIPSPRRGGASEDQGFHDSYWNVVRLGVRAAADMLIMAWMVLTSPWPKICGWLLKHTQSESLQTLIRSDAVFVKGGGFVHAYKGVRWLYYLLYQLFPVMLALRLRKKVIILPNSYGPFHGVLSRALVSSVFRKCNLVTARERISAEIMSGMLDRSVPVFPDMAFGLRPSSPEWAKNELIMKGIPISQRPCIGITVRPWRFPEHPNPSEAFAQYIDSMRHLVVTSLELGFYPVIFAHSLGPSHHEDDRIAIKALMEHLEGASHDISVVESPDYTGSDLMALYGQMTMMVATRFHSVIFAAVMGVPSIAVAYGGNKGVGIMSEMGLRDYVIPINDVTPCRLEAAFNQLVKNLDAARAMIGNYVHKSNEELDSLVELIRSVLSSS